MMQIGLKTEDKVYIGTFSQSYTLSSAAYRKNNIQLFTPKNHPELLISFSGTFVLHTIFRFYNQVLENVKDSNYDLNISFIYHQITNPFIKSLYETKYLEEGSEFESVPTSLLIARDNKLFEVSYGLQCTEVDDFKVVDDGEITGTAYLKCLDSKLDPIYRMLKTFYTVNSDGQYGSYPISISDTSNTKKIRTFSLEETIKYINNYERKVGIR